MEDSPRGVSAAQEYWVAVPSRERQSHRIRTIFDDGLWHVYREGHTPTEMPICSVDRGDDHDPPSRAKAESYARLIAAAPELLDACRMALVSLKQGSKLGVTILERVIAKAEGR